jgi:hypothetical protein
MDENEPMERWDKRLVWLAICATVAVIAFVIWIDYNVYYLS